MKQWMLIIRVPCQDSHYPEYDHVIWVGAHQPTWDTVVSVKSTRHFLSAEEVVIGGERRTYLSGAGGELLELGVEGNEVDTSEATRVDWYTRGRVPAMPEELVGKTGMDVVHMLDDRARSWDEQTNPELEKKLWELCESTEWWEPLDEEMRLIVVREFYN